MLIVFCLVSVASFLLVGVSLSQWILGKLPNDWQQVSFCVFRYFRLFRQRFPACFKNVLDYRFNSSAARSTVGK